jgi:hypothetical protein
MRVYVIVDASEIFTYISRKTWIGSTRCPQQKIPATSQSQGLLFPSTLFTIHFSLFTYFSNHSSVSQSI